MSSGRSKQIPVRATIVKDIVIPTSVAKTQPKRGQNHQIKTQQTTPKNVIQKHPTISNESLNGSIYDLWRRKNLRANGEFMGLYQETSGLSFNPIHYEPSFALDPDREYCSNSDNQPKSKSSSTKSPPLKSILKTSIFSIPNNFCQCNVCQKTFKTKQGLGSHMKIVHEKRNVDQKKGNNQNRNCNLVFTCPFCSQSYARMEATNNHVIQFHKVKVLILYCEECGLGFFHESMLQEHKEGHLVVLISSVPVGNEAESTNSMATSLETSSVESAAKEIGAPEEFALLDSSSISVPEEEPSIVVIKEFLQKDRSQVQLVYPYSTFVVDPEETSSDSTPRGTEPPEHLETNSQNLLCHEATIPTTIIRDANDTRVSSPAPEELKSFKHPRRECSFCAKTISVKYYKTHKKIHSAADSDLVTCPDCSKQYRTNYYLKRHIESSHDFKINHTCHVCLKGYYRRRDQQKHISIDHGLIRFVCVECLKDNKYKDGLQAQNSSVPLVIDVITNSPFPNPPNHSAAAAINSSVAPSTSSVKVHVQNQAQASSSHKSKIPPVVVSPLKSLTAGLKTVNNSRKPASAMAMGPPIQAAAHVPILWSKKPVALQLVPKPKSSYAPQLPAQTMQKPLQPGFPHARPQQPEAAAGSFFEKTLNKSYAGCRRCCPDCGKDYAASYLNKHKAKAHPQQNQNQEQIQKTILAKETMFTKTSNGHARA